MILLVQKLLPLYLLIAIGRYAAKTLSLDKRSISALVIYFITPVIVFYGTSQVPFSLTTLVVPIISLLLFALCGFIARQIAYICWFSVSERNLLSFMWWNGNTGYFGIPLVLWVLGEHYLGYAVLVGLWALLYENTLGMYYLASTTFSPQKALKKVLSMPTIYGFICGVIVSAIWISFPESVHTFFLQYKAAYIVIGMMIIGIGLSRTDSWTINHSFILFSLLQKLIVMPLVWYFMFLLLVQVFPSFLPFQSTFYLISLVPIAAWTISLAIEFKYDVYQPAVCVLISTCLALITAPAFISLMPYLWFSNW